MGAMFRVSFVLLLVLGVVGCMVQLDQEMQRLDRAFP